jgi:hypothetical protein
MLEGCVNSLAAGAKEVVKRLTLTYAALACGGTFAGDGGGDTVRRLVAACRSVLGAELSLPPGIKKETKQACRSIFQYAKW